jgi:beta-ribofuranosylaminobenzene 5'-phosphate synthase
MILVEASARIHMGFYNFLTDEVAYGDLGVAIDAPKVVVKLSRIGSDKVVIVNRSGVEVSDIIDALSKVFNLQGLSIEILSAIPRHIGLGSTTQTLLALAYGISKALGLKYSVRELAVKFCRGRDSGVGIAVFEKGGFVVNSGRRLTPHGKVLCPESVNDLPQTIFRAPVPRGWSFILFIPRRRRGFDEVSERRAMDIPIELPKDLQFELYKLVFLHMLPAILRRDIDVFGKALTKLQLIVGEYFSKYQGGVFCCEEVELIARSMLEYGAKGVGQSSWGPTVYGIVEGYAKAKKILNSVLKLVERRGIEVDYMIVKGRNKGAEVVIE